MFRTDEKDFDAVIDRGSIGAIYPEDRPRYIPVVICRVLEFSVKSLL